MFFVSSRGKAFVLLLAIPLGWAAPLQTTETLAAAEAIHNEGTAIRNRGDLQRAEEL
jgi:hypothetical protein